MLKMRLFGSAAVPASHSVMGEQAVSPALEVMPIWHGVHIMMKSSATSLDTRSVVRPIMASALTVIVSPTLYLW